MDGSGYVHAAMKVYDSLFQVYYSSMLQQFLSAALLRFSVHLGQLSKYHHVRRAVQFGGVQERTVVL